MGRKCTSSTTKNTESQKKTKSLQTKKSSVKTVSRKKKTVNSETVDSNKEEKVNLQLAEFEKKIYDLEQMISISRSFCSTIELTSLIESILYIAMAQLRVTSSGIFVLPEYGSDQYHLADHYSGLEVDPSKSYIIPADSALVEFMSTSNKVYTLKELQEQLPDCKDIDTLALLKPSLVVPLILKNRVNGILLMGDRIIVDGMDNEYNDYERNEISTIASLASVAIHNASLIEQSSTDMMTKLKLKFFFFNVLEDKLDAAFVNDNSLSVIMFDIDFFKKFNDTYGHACGDYVLISVAKIIKDSIRGDDMASRYGGEEFTVMLPNTNAEEAEFVGERIRKNIESHDFVFEGQHMHVTISGGISVFSLDKNPVRTAKALVDQADKALYISKRNGRNRLTVIKEPSDE
ncbi:MAG: sensor domain-containing diguanylate cyclase [Treponema sp.]|nr:sensor domain-containing diguanylate cyclase [Treponema sp.]